MEEINEIIESTKNLESKIKEIESKIPKRDESFIIANIGQEYTISQSSSEIMSEDKLLQIFTGIENAIKNKKQQLLQTKQNIDNMAQFIVNTKKDLEVLESRRKELDEKVGAIRIKKRKEEMKKKRLKK